MNSPSDRLRIVVLGYVIRGPLAGMAWHHLQYVLGLARLGHDVYFFEDSGDSRYCCYDPLRGVTDADASYGLRFAADAFRRIGLVDRWAYYNAHRTEWVGPAATHAVEVCQDADLVLNLSLANPLRPWLANVATRVVIDTDPVFTQVRNLTDTVRRELTAAHTAFFSFGGNVGRGNCAIPVDGFPWLPTRQPIVLDAWPVTAGRREGPFTSVLQWESYAARLHDGRRFGTKAHSFEPYFDLPRKADSRFLLAVGAADDVRSRLRRNGWTLCDPLTVSRNLWTYQRFLRSSAAEFGVAKEAYVVTGSGWFSERSACYLASGRPTVVQETGASSWLPTGSGVLAFTSSNEAAGLVRAVVERYDEHCAAARAIAEEYFDSNRVLTRLLDDAFMKKWQSASSELAGVD
jgi:hypothetical protein